MEAEGGLSSGPPALACDGTGYQGTPKPSAIAHSRQTISAGVSILRQA